MVGPILRSFRNVRRALYWAGEYSKGRRPSEQAVVLKPQAQGLPERYLVVPWDRVFEVPKTASYEIVVEPAVFSLRERLANLWSALNEELLPWSGPMGFEQ